MYRIYLKLIFFSLFINIFIFASTVRIMPLGDSITFDDSHADKDNPRPNGVRHAYRNYLWYLLQDANYDVDFVGSRIAGWDIEPPFDPDNQGYPGYTSDEISDLIYSKLKQNPADIVLLHIGSNDWSRSVNGVKKILNEIDRYENNYNHPITVVVAKIINKRTHTDLISDFNVNLQDLINSRIDNGDNLYMVDMEHDAGLSYSNYRDKIHPTNSGYSKMADVWFEALEDLLAPVIPHKITYLSTSNMDTHSTTLTWQDNADNETGFKIYQNGNLVATLNKNKTHYILDNLEPRATYTYSVVAYNEAGASDSTNITFTTKDDYTWLPAIYHTIL